jgi:hypothetical protein
LSPAPTSSGWDISSDPSKNQRPSGLLNSQTELVCELELECYNFERALVKATPDISHTQ